MWLPTLVARTSAVATSARAHAKAVGAGKLIGAARFSDGRIATKTFVLTILDELEQTVGTGTGEELVGTIGKDIIRGLEGDDVLWCLDGDDRLLGGAGADILQAGNDDDWLTGGDASDLFAFRENEGTDMVIDFTPGLDKIVLIGTAAPELGSAQGSALIEFGGTEILLQGVKPAELSLEDFIFLGSLG